MIWYRIRQGIDFLFAKYDDKNNTIVKKILNTKEFEIFDKMKDYDKNHSLKVLKLVNQNDLLKDEIFYKKLALLHDCGKGEMELLSRIKKVFFGDNHSTKGYEKLKDIDKNLATMVKNHHNKSGDTYMTQFQQIDDKC